MQYFKQLLSASLDQTWDLVVDSKLVSLVVATLVVAVTWVMKNHLEGDEAAKADIKDHFFYTLIPLASVFAVLFVVHFLIISPRKMFLEESTRAAGLDARLESEAPVFIPRNPGLNFVTQTPKPDDPWVTTLDIIYDQKGKRDAKNVRVKSTTIDKITKTITLTKELDQFSRVIPGGAYTAVVDFIPPVRISNLRPLLIAQCIYYYDEAAQKELHQIEYFHWGSRNGSGVVTTEGSLATIKETEEIERTLRAANVTYP